MGLEHVVLELESPSYPQPTPLAQVMDLCSPSDLVDETDRTVKFTQCDLRREEEKEVGLDESCMPERK